MILICAFERFDTVACYFVCFVRRLYVWSHMCLSDRPMRLEKIFFFSSVSLKQKSLLRQDWAFRHSIVSPFWYFSRGTIFFFLPPTKKFPKNTPRTFSCWTKHPPKNPKYLIDFLPATAIAFPFCGNDLLVTFGHPKLVWKGLRTNMSPFYFGRLFGVVRSCMRSPADFPSTANLLSPWCNSHSKLLVDGVCTNQNTFVLWDLRVYEIESSGSK